MNLVLNLFFVMFQNHNGLSRSAHSSFWSKTDTDPALEPGQCIWYDTCSGCNDHDQVKHDYNFAYNGPPKPLNSTILEDLAGVCPELIAELGIFTYKSSNLPFMN